MMVVSARRSTIARCYRCSTSSVSGDACVASSCPVVAASCRRHHRETSDEQDHRRRIDRGRRGVHGVLRQSRQRKRHRRIGAGRSEPCRTDPERRRDLRGEPLVRQSVRTLSRRARPEPGDRCERQSHGRLRAAARSGRQDVVAGAAADLGRGDVGRRHAGGDAGTERRSAERTVRHRDRVPRRIGRDARPLGHDARPVSPLLREPDADRQRRQRRLRRMVRCGRPHDGPLRHASIGAVCAREAVRAGRSFLPGRVRRIVPEPSVPDLQLCAGIPERRHIAGEAVDRRARPRCNGQSIAASVHRTQLAGVGARRATGVCDERQHHAGQLFRRRPVLRGQHDAASVSTERQRSSGRRRACICRSDEGDHAAGADGADHRRPALRQGYPVGVVRAVVEGRHRGWHAAAEGEEEGDLRAGGRTRRTRTFRRITCRSTTTRPSIP